MMGLCDTIPRSHPHPKALWQSFLSFDTSRLQWIDSFVLWKKEVNAAVAGEYPVSEANENLILMLS